MDYEESPILGPDEQRISSKLTPFRRTVQKVASLGKYSKTAAVSLLAVSGWFVAVGGNLEEIKDLAYGRHPDVRIVKVNTHGSSAFITMTNEGNKPTVVTDAVLQITGVAKVTFDVQRCVAVPYTSAVEISRTYPIDLYVSTLVDTPTEVVIKGFGHALVENEVDAFNLDFHSNSWTLEKDDENVSLVFGFRAHVILHYDNGRQAISPSFVVRPFRYRLQVRSSDVTDEELRKKDAEIENAVRELEPDD